MSKEFVRFMLRFMLMVTVVSVALFGLDKMAGIDPEANPTMWAYGLGCIFIGLFTGLFISTLFK